MPGVCDPTPSPGPSPPSVPLGPTQPRGPGTGDPGCYSGPSPPSTPPGPSQPRGPGTGGHPAAEPAPDARPEPERHPPRWPAGRRLLAVAAGAAGMAAAVALAWSVLVTVRIRTLAPATGDPAADRAVEVVTDTMLADRVQSVAQWVANVATTFVLGGIAFRSFVAGPFLRPRQGRDQGRNLGDRARRAPTGLAALRVAALAGMASAAVTVVPRAAAVAGGFGALDLEVLRFAAESRFGDAVLLRLAGLALLLGLALPRDPRRTGWSVQAGCISGTVLVLASFALGGHARVTDPAYVLVLVQATHVVAVSLWFGGVASLALQQRWIRRLPRPGQATAVVARFSRVAMASVVVAVVTGAMLAASQLSTPTALVSTPYGRALSAKLAVLSLALALGGCNDRWLVPAIVRRDEPRAWWALQLTVMVEATVLAAGVLLLTAAMTSGGI